MVEGKTRNNYSRIDEVRGESEWKVNSEEKYRKEDSRKKEGERRKEWLEKKEKRSCRETGQKIEEYTRKKAAEMQMIGLQATELYLQTEEAYFSAVIFLFLLFHPRLVVLFSYLGPLFFLKMLLLHSTGSDEIKMHYSFVDSCSIHSMVESDICILNSHI